MIQNYFRWTRLRVPFLAAIMALLSLPSWADTTGTITFGSGSGSTRINSPSVTASDNQGKTWTINTESKQHYFNQYSLYSQVGSEKKPATSITFTATIADANVNITSFRIKIGGFSGTAGSITLKVGNTTVGSGSLSGSSDIIVSSTKSAEGKVLTVTVTGISKGVAVYFISYTYETEKVTVGSAGYTAYVTSKSVRFPEGVTGYIATANTGETLTLTSRASVPAGTPVVIKAASGSYDLPVTTTPESVEGNLLLASDGTVTGNGSIYALGLGKTGENAGKVGFYVVNTGVNVPAGKAYLDLSGSNVKEFLMFDFDNEETGIRETANAECRMSNTIFDISGRRIKDSQLKRGIYVVNGKKVVIK